MWKRSLKTVEYVEKLRMGEIAVKILGLIAC